jgi:hypothetical protein
LRTPNVFLQAKQGPGAQVFAGSLAMGGGVKNERGKVGFGRFGLLCGA